MCVIWHMHTAHVHSLLMGRRALRAWLWVRAGQGGGGGIQLAQLQHISLLNSSEMLQREVSQPGKCQAYPAFPMHSAVEAGSHGKSMHHFLHFCDTNLKWFLPKGAGILSWEQKNVDCYQQPKQNTSHLLWSALSPTEGRLPACWQLIHSSAPCPALGSTGKYWSWCTPEIQKFTYA